METRSFHCRNPSEQSRGSRRRTALEQQSRRLLREPWPRWLLWVCLSHGSGIFALVFIIAVKATGVLAQAEPVKGVVPYTLLSVSCKKRYIGPYIAIRAFQHSFNRPMKPKCPSKGLLQPRPHMIPGGHMTSISKALSKRIDASVGAQMRTSLHLLSLRHSSMNCSCCM